MTVTGEHDDDAKPFPGRWRAEIDAIVASLAAHLGQEVTVVNVTEMDDAFSCLVRGPVPSGTDFQVSWEGVLGMEPIEGKPDISVSLFLYSRRRRVRLAEHHGSYLELVYEGAFDGTGAWRDCDWLEDHFGEFDAHDQYGD